MAKGQFTVSINPKNPQDILFTPAPGVSNLDDEEQLALRDEIDRTLSILRILFKEDEQSFQYYFQSILSLAQAGLVSDYASPKVSKRALDELKNEILAREGGKVKNRYMRELGKKVLSLGLPTFIIGSFFFFSKVFAPQTAFLFLWSGAMCGVWLSFGVRKSIFKFQDLAIIEEDRLDPTIRLIFTGLLTVIIGLLLATGVLTINIGSVSTTAFEKDIRVALLIGMSCGFSEQALPEKIKEQTSKFLGK